MYAVISKIVVNKKSGRYEMRLLKSVASFRGFQFNVLDIEKLGPHYKVASDKLQRIATSFFSGLPNNGQLVVAIFDNPGTNLVLKRIHPVNGKETKMSAEATCLVKINGATRPSPEGVREALDAMKIKGLFPLVVVAYAAVQAKPENTFVMPMSFELEEAKALVDILKVDGTVAAVHDSSNDEILYSPVHAADVSSVVETTSEVNTEYFYVSPVLKDIANVVAAMATSPKFRSTSVIISGPSGWGKTGFCAPLAKALGMSLEYIDMSLIMETEELYGKREIVENSTTFEFNHFVAAVERGNTVVVLDELNRTYPGALNSLFPLLDWRGETVIHNRKIVVGPRTIFVATRNVGSSYVGTQASDGALVSRFEFGAMVDSIEHEEEVKLLVNRCGISKSVAHNIVRAANAVRDVRDLGVNVSPRTTISVANMVASAGLTPRAAFQWALVLKEEEQEVRVQLETMLNRTFGMEYGAAMSASTLKSIF
jgi:MoxR-like ATPase